jgi:TetR/AcrR family transcriptional regulator, repressor for divergent bdcA
MVMMATELTVSRGRPRKFDVENGVAIALKLFSKHGYDAVGVNEICTKVGITPTSLYAAYGSKLNLFKRAISSYIAGPGQFVGKALEQANSPSDVWQRILLAAAKQYSAGPERGCPVLDGLLGSRETEVIAFTASHADATQQAIFKRLQALGDEKAELNAATILLVMRGLSTSARSSATIEKLDAMVATLIEKHSGNATPN